MHLTTSIDNKFTCFPNGKSPRVIRHPTASSAEIEASKALYISPMMQSKRIQSPDPTHPRTSNTELPAFPLSMTNLTQLEVTSA